jgi:hypothetical protein
LRNKLARDECRRSEPNRGGLDEAQHFDGDGLRSETGLTGEAGLRTNADDRIELLVFLFGHFRDALSAFVNEHMASAALRDAAAFRDDFFAGREQRLEQGAS